MILTNSRMRDISIEIIKEYSRGGGDHPATKLKEVYEALKEINKEAEDSNPVAFG
jgi:hypothetical protein